jgi:hypothetical protein
MPLPAVIMLFSTTRTIKIDKPLYEQLASVAKQKGYSSADELILHVLEAAVAPAEEQLDAQRAEQQLRGLGYLE